MKIKQNFAQAWEIKGKKTYFSICLNYAKLFLDKGSAGHSTISRWLPMCCQCYHGSDYHDNENSIPQRTNGAMNFGVTLFERKIWSCCWLN